ncbi:hypothetical protein LWI28_020536 [Acer negundo]|uniref:SWIM-type domain-containing protein n=1 Tax=Acer negundo TaxID=4023 RepID=A0AAD5JG16_ACENE|nr:hypothetical protein LWI28_020536 [Acer negundo]
MVRFYEKWDEVEKWNDSITPYAREMLDTNEKEARKLQIIHGRGEWYETIDKYGKKFLVSVVDVMCDCGMWQISGLPCMHVIAVFMYRREFAQLTNMRQLTNMISGLPCMHVIAVFMYRVISGLPCMHVIAVFMYRREFAQDYVHWYYSKEAMKMTYAGTINPIPDESRCPTTNQKLLNHP